jgi:hypothetical protein
LTESFLLTLPLEPKPKPVLLPVEAITGFRKTGVLCEHCGQEARGLDRVNQGVYCTREGCYKGWRKQGPLPQLGLRQPANEVYSLHWLRLNGFTSPA